MKIRIAWFLWFLVLLISYGCASTKVSKGPTVERTAQREVTKSPLTAGEPQAMGAETEKEKTPSFEVSIPPAFKKPAPGKDLPSPKPFDPKSLALTKEPVVINVEKMPLRDFIIYALGETLKVSFVMDQKVMDRKELITLAMPEPVPSDKALEIVLGLFEKYNLHLEEKAGALYILSKSPDPKRPLGIKVGRDIPESRAQILQVVPLRYIRPVEIEPLLKAFYKTDVQIRPYPRENVILFYGEALQIRQIMEFVETIDVPYLQGKKITVLRLTYWQIDDFIKQISPILEGLGLSIAKSPRDPGILLVPIKPLRSLLVIAPDDTSINYVRDWREKLDKPEAALAEERAFVYTPKYSRASDLVKSISNLYGIMPAAAPTPPSTVPAAPTVPPAPGKPPASPSSGAAPLARLKISSDDQRNIIMIVSSPPEYKNILSLLEELDLPPRQVLIEATVAELTLTDDLKFGLEWFLKSSVSTGSLQGTSALKTLFSVPSGGPGLVYQFITDNQNFTALINAFAVEDKINVLSAPRLMVLDNQEATIQVGTDVPIVTGEVSASDIVQSVPSILRNIQYRNTGVILRVKPTINTGGLLTLNITQEVSEIGTNPPGINSPSILMRRINTSVVAAHGQTIALGGLMSENIGFTENKIPILGDIPILGYLFKTTSKTSRKTELLVFLTPTILTTVDDIAKITKELKNEFKMLKLF